MSWFKKKAHAKVVSLSNGKFIAMVYVRGGWDGLDPNYATWSTTRFIHEYCQVNSSEEALQLINNYLNPPKTIIQEITDARK